MFLPPKKEQNKTNSVWMLCLNSRFYNVSELVYSCSGEAVFDTTPTKFKFGKPPMSFHNTPHFPLLRYIIIACLLIYILY